MKVHVLLFCIFEIKNVSVIHNGILYDSRTMSIF